METVKLLFKPRESIFFKSQTMPTTLSSGFSFKSSDFYCNIRQSKIDRVIKSHPPPPPIRDGKIYEWEIIFNDAFP